MNRRQFFAQAGKTFASALTAATGLWLYSRHLRRPPVLHQVNQEPSVLRPPGALAEPAFLTACIRCNNCQNACPSRAILLAGPNDPAMLGTPFIIPHENACTLCLECTKVCPTGAIKPIEDKKDVKMGLAVVDERTCVSFNGTGICGACHTACPLKNSAITQGLHNTPTVHEEACVGCGLCEEACIVKGTKAIRVFSERKSA